MKFIKYKTAKTLKDMEKIILYDHQLFDDDYPKETLIPLADTDPLVAWIQHIGKAKAKFKRNSIVLVDIILYCPCDSTEQDKIQRWKEDCVSFISGKFGFDNIMTATYHSVTKPHIHFAIIPVFFNNLSWSHYTQRDNIRIPAFEYEYINDILLS